MKQTIKKRVVYIALALLVTLIFIFYYVHLQNNEERKIETVKNDLPSPVAEVSPNKASEIKRDIPEEMNIAVPFISQAPKFVWDQKHEEACEEAAMLMAKRYFKSELVGSADDSENGLNQIINYEMDTLGFFESTTANQSARIIIEMFALNAELKLNPTVSDIKTAISEGKLVITPAAGRQLRNPFYKQPGPIYHYLLIKGYTKTQFITNDPGTKRGENYPYDFEVVMDAVHDYNGGDVEHGDKVVIFVSK